MHTPAPSIIDEELERYLQELERVYASEHQQTAWASEGPIIRSYIPHIRDKISYNYDIQSPFRLGGTGFVTIVKDKNLGTLRVLKIPRPKILEADALARLLTKETENLRRLSHQNLIQISAKFSVEVDVPSFGTRDIPFYIMEYIAEAQDASEYFSRSTISENEILVIFEGILSAIDYMHRNGYLHFDIKPSNILITPQGQAILADLGFAKNIKTATGYSLLGGTPGFMHPEFERFIEVYSARQDKDNPLPENSLKQEWDLYGLGKTILKLLESAQSISATEFRPYTRRYLKLLACRLLDGRNAEAETTLGINRALFSEIKYLTAKDALADFYKLTGARDLTKIITELDHYSNDTIQLTANFPTPFSSRLGRVMSAPVFLRLDNITQLGLINLIFPGAKHTRFAHSIGTFAMTCRIVGSLYHDQLNPLFRQLMDEDDLKAVLLAALLHDVGQYPLAHDLEEVDLELFKHETLTKHILGQHNGELWKIIEKEWKLDPDRIIAILEAKKSKTNSLKNTILRSIVDGPFDSDKLDYLIRDSRSCGLLHAEGLDIRRLISCFSIVVKRDQAGKTVASLGIHEKGKIAAEDVAWLRYKMYGIVYWHHTYRAIKAMLHRTAWEYLEQLKASTTNYRSDFQKRFWTFLLKTPDLTPNDEFSFTSDLNPGIAGGVVEDSQINHNDLNTFRFFCLNAGSNGEKIFELIKRRKVYRRVFVAVKKHFEEWERVKSVLTARENTPGLEAWELKLKFQRALQFHISKVILENTAVTSNLADRMRTHEKEAIILIDMPGDRQGVTKGFEFIVEEDRRRWKQDDLKSEQFEESSIYKVIQQEFHNSIGKLRIFCHPDFFDDFYPYLDRETIEPCIVDALNDIQK